MLSLIFFLVFKNLSCILVCNYYNIPCVNNVSMYMPRIEFYLLNHKKFNRVPYIHLKEEEKSRENFPLKYTEIGLKLLNNFFVMTISQTHIYPFNSFL